jgi:hypothetical protein
MVPETNESLVGISSPKSAFLKVYSAKEYNLSLHIEVDDVKFVLLADGWHEVAGDSFDLDAYEFHHENKLLLKGGKVRGVPSTGARWQEKNGQTIMCPITSILAVKTSKRRRSVSRK